MVAVSVSSDAEGGAGLGSYVGLWAEGDDAPTRWLHVPSAVVVGSLNDDWFAWGGGSDAVSTGMYALDLNNGDVKALGDASGYARPALAPDQNILLLPHSDGQSAASWSVVSLEA